MTRRKNIALFMAILENDFSSDILKGASMAAADEDVNLIVFPMDILEAKFYEDSINLYRYQNNVLSSFWKEATFDGIIIEYGTIVSQLAEEQKLEFLKTLGDTPTLLLAEEVDGYSCICVDNTTGLKEILEHIIRYHHCQKIGFMSGPQNNHDADARLQIYKDVMNSYGIYPGEDWIVYGNFSVYVEDLAIEMIQSHPDIEAIVCANDHMALGVAHAMEKLGLIPGKDILITGFDDVMPAYLNNPSLTTVKADPAELSYEAVRQLCHSENRLISKKIPTHMVVRESCGCNMADESHSKKIEFGIQSDWRIETMRRYSEDVLRNSFVAELSNITREMVFSYDNEEERYGSILNALRRLNINGSFLFLHDEYIQNLKTSTWQLPKEINLVAYYYDDKNHVYPKGEQKIDLQCLFNNPIVCGRCRHEYIMLPLFFGKDQLGFFLVDTQAEHFKYVYPLAGQISNTLAIADINVEQKKMRRELEEASKYKSQFLANMSHEIRTPINAVIGFTEMILRESKDQNIDEYATDVKHAASTLLGLVNDILDFSKIEAGKMNLVFAEYRPKELVLDLIKMMEPRANAKNLKLSVSFDEKIPNILYGDDGRIKQILLNLISNAIKYTKEGTIELSVAASQRMEKSTEEVVLKFAIKDTGIGIRKSDIEHLFVKFERLDERRNRNIEGTGLGINITQGLLELMGSHLEVQSIYGKGSTFSFNITQKVIDQTASGTIEDKSAVRDTKHIDLAKFTAPDAKVLVVDDNALNRRVISRLLKHTQIQVDLADGGLQCLELMQQKEYDIVLLDHMMPEIDGIETLHLMEQKKFRTEKKPIVIALTANAIAGAQEMYLSEGFDDYLSKPVEPKKLNEMLAHYLKI